MARRTLSLEQKAKAEQALTNLEEHLSDFPAETKAEEHVAYIEAIADSFALQNSQEAMWFAVYFRKEAKAVAAKYKEQQIV
jgi:hypothetical protein